jgi:methylmalonyl-CoA mutase
VESLTIAFIDAAWERFMDVEGKGGLLACLVSGYVQEGIEKSLNAAQTRAAGRALRIVGTNMYANTTEKALERETKTSEAVLINVDTLDIKDLDAMEKAFESGINILSVFKTLGEKGGETCKKIDEHRLSEQFEKLRNDIAQNGGITVFLANMGPVSQHKARADFSTGFFEVGGCTVITNSGFGTTDEAAQAAVNSGADVCVICSTDDTYPEIVPALAKAVKDKNAKIQVILAGMPNPDFKDSYFAAGLDDAIHIRSNCLETLRQINARKGEK